MSDTTTPTATTGTPGTPEPAWHDACALNDLAPNMGKYIELNKQPVAIFKSPDNTVKAINDICPHAGGSLASGYVREGCVYCPWHGWPFRTDNGECPDNPSIKVATYEVRVVDGRVQVKA